MRGLSSRCRLGGSSARQQSLRHLEGRPCRALPFRSYGLPRVWLPLQGYAPWALEGSPRWGLLAQSYPQSEEYNLDYKGTRASHPHARYCASIHGHCGISSQGAAVCASKAQQYALLRVRGMCPSRHRGSSHGYCGISFQGAAVCASKVLRFHSRVLRYFLPKALQYALPRVRGYMPSPR